MIDYGVDALHLIDTYKISVETLLPAIGAILAIGIIGYKVRKYKKNTSNKTQIVKSTQKAEDNRTIKNNVNADDLRCKAAYDLDYGGKDLVNRLKGTPNEPKNPKKYESLYMEFDKTGKKI